MKPPSIMYPLLLMYHGILLDTKEALTRHANLPMHALCAYPNAQLKVRDALVLFESAEERERLGGLNGTDDFGHVCRLQLVPFDTEADGFMIYVENALPSHTRDCATFNPVLTFKNKVQKMGIMCHRSVSRFFAKPVVLTFLPVAIRTLVDSLYNGKGALSSDYPLRITLTAVVVNCNYNIHTNKWMACPAQRNICIHRHQFCDGLNNCGVFEDERACSYVPPEMRQPTATNSPPHIQIAANPTIVEKQATNLDADGQEEQEILQVLPTKSSYTYDPDIVEVRPQVGVPLQKSSTGRKFGIGSMGIVLAFFISLCCISSMCFGVLCAYRTQAAANRTAFAEYAATYGTQSANAHFQGKRHSYAIDKIMMEREGGGKRNSSHGVVLPAISIEEKMLTSAMDGMPNNSLLRAFHASHMNTVAITGTVVGTVPLYRNPTLPDTSPVRSPRVSFNSPSLNSSTSSIFSPDPPAVDRSRPARRYVQRRKSISPKQSEAKLVSNHTINRIFDNSDEGNDKSTEPIVIRF